MRRRKANTIGNANDPTGLMAQGIWALGQVDLSRRQNSWPRPTIATGGTLIFNGQYNSCIYQQWNL